ncbi:MAG: diaminopimelate epimerase [Chloroflexi bacterium RBG_13_52_12]|nr:MAG: diaminopimelate epimerase [Chloroflexi bacterium RBG_13_52_12]
MDFTKMHGAANDFVMMDGRSKKRDWSKLAITVCDRHRGIGADSLIVLLPSDKADFGMRTWDTDGSEAETCGNGIRCMAMYVLEKGLAAPDIEEMTIETVATVNRIKLERKGGKVVKLWANMGKPRLSAAQIPVNLTAGKGEVIDIKSMIRYKVTVKGMELTLNLVSMGNPHAVHFTQEPVVDFPLSSLGPLVENLPIFPNRVNFEVARVLDKKHIEARVWERGVGETMACGSGACAITVASKLRGDTESKVDIQLRGGTLNAEWNGNGEVVLGGPAVVVYEGKWPD